MSHDGINLEVRELTNEAYHADVSAVSSSMLNDFARSRSLYFRRHIERSEGRRQPTGSMQLGTALHTLLLEPARAAVELVQIPRAMLSKSGARAGKVWEQYAASQSGKQLLNEREMAAVHAMAHSARRAAAEWFAAPGVVEQSLYYTDIETGLRCKVRTDWRTQCADGRPLVVDVKTSREATPAHFAVAYREYGYGIQECHYRMAILANTGLDAVYRFLVVQNCAPHVARIFAATEAEYGQQLVRWRVAMRDLAECYRTGNWSDAP